jgi:basic membrane lipoprotein Med (substrate-binding protein (PBP1-ABC) superfamily)
LRSVPARLLCAITLLIPLAFLSLTAAGCGSQSAAVKVGVIEIQDSFPNPASVKLVDSGIQQLTSELAVDAELVKCKAAALGEEVESLGGQGESFILVTGRGNQVLDPAKRNPDIPLAALGMSLKDPRGNAINSDGVTCVRYKVEEGAYLSGVLAAALTVTRGHPWINPEAVVGFIGCPEDPFEAAYVKGFEAGVASVNPNCAVAEYEIPNTQDIASTRAVVDVALKLKADIIFCVPGAFSEEVLALAGARGFLVITSDADGSDQNPDALLAETVLRDDLAMFRVTREFLQDRLSSGQVAWGMAEDIIDFSVNMKLSSYVSSSIEQLLKQPVPNNIYTQ